MRKALFLFFVFAFAFGFELQAQPQKPYIQNFTPSEYGQQYSANTFAIATDSNGIVYVGTAYGILQYDGQSWRFINVKVGTYVTALKVHNNKVYVGCIGDFGYLETGAGGRYQYHSLVDQLEEDDRAFSRIWKIIEFENRLAFQAEEKFFLLRDDSLQVIEPNTSFHLSYASSNQLVVREREKGLSVLVESHFEHIGGSEVFSEMGVFAILPRSHSALLLTRELGFWEWKNGGFARLHVEKGLSAMLQRSDVVGAIALDDGNIAIFTQKNGILIVDKNLHLAANYSTSSGLPSSEVYDLIQDGAGDLWAATPKGVSRIQYSSQYSQYGPTEGLYGEVLSLLTWGKRYLVGTTQGLFISSSEGAKAFYEVEQVTGGVWQIIETDGACWIATENGLWRYNGVDFIQVNRMATTALTYIKEKEWIVGAGPQGLYIRDAMLNAQQTFSEIKVEAYGIVGSIEDNGDCELWIGSKTSGVWQVVIAADFKLKIFDIYGLLDGLEEDWVCPYNMGMSQVFATSRGLLKFISADEIYQMLNDSTISKFDIRGMFSPIDLPKNALYNAVTALLYDSRTSFMAIDFNVHQVNMLDSLSSDYSLKSLRLGKLNALERSGQNLLIGGRDGLAIANLDKGFERSYPMPKIVLRSLTIGPDSVAWWGDATPENLNIEIPYSKNSITLVLTSMYNDNGIGAEYAWRFKDGKKNYSRWNVSGTIEIPNLREGNYVFEAIARNIHGQLSEPVVFKFRALPPWYRTIFAYVGYAITLVGLVYLLVQMNIKRLKAQNKRLEEIVKQRTSEIVEQKEHIEKQKERIEHILEDIQASINYAQRIQQALLPGRELLDKLLPGNFIIFYPRDVVSGDFYWSTQVGDWVVATVADCTGHGVPGAFMSMLGISLLNEIVGKQKNVMPCRILGDMRQAIIEALKQNTEYASQKDGMDMSLIVINLKTRVCRWAGANNPLYVVRNKSIDVPLGNDNEKAKQTEYDNCILLELKHDRMPVAIHTVLHEFTSHEIQLQRGDRLFMFSDGYADQFGGNEYRKYMSRAFKELIANTSSIPIVKQGEAIDNAFQEWVNYDGKSYDQIDDVTVMGLEV